MDALKNITNNVPDWLQRLGDLSGQIEQRQAELASLGQSSTKSIRNKGSNESLLRKEENEPTPTSPTQDKGVEAPVDTEPAEPAEPTKPHGQVSAPPATTSSEIQQQTKQAMTTAQARARAQVRKRHRSQSIVSVEGNPAAYRSRSMIIVYYDSYVEGFFEELVKFVSASRNLMRKAKMAAKVAQIKRMAEMDNQDDDDDDDNPETPSRPLPSLRYLSSSRTTALSPSVSRVTGARGGGGGGAGAGAQDSSSDFYDKLDKGLEYVQSMCERAAHQFLRDGDCNEEINNISTRLAETKELALMEGERILREEPELAKESADAGKFRTHRPPAVRRDLSSGKESKEAVAGREAKDAKKTEPELEAVPATIGIIEAKKPSVEQPLEVDDDEGIEDVEFKLPPRPTRRAMRTRVLQTDADATTAAPAAGRTT